MDFRVARIDPSRGGGILETRGKLIDFKKNSNIAMLRPGLRKLSMLQIYLENYIKLRVFSI